MLKSTDVAAKPRPPSRGEPLKYNETVAARICELMSEGLSIQAIVRDYHHEGIPQAISTIYRWIATEPGFSEIYTQARLDQQQFYIDQMIDIADGDEPSDQKRVRLDARKWLASKLLPNQYGDRVRAEVTGADGGPVQVQATVVDAASLDVAQRESLKAALMAVRGKREDDDA